MKLILSRRALVSGIAILAVGILLGGATAYWFVQHKVAVVDASSSATTQKASAKSSTTANVPAMDMSGKSGSGQPSAASPGSSSGQMAGMEMPEGDSMPAGTVMLDPATQQEINVTYTTVRRAHLVRTIQTVGLLHTDEEKIAHVHVKVAGWIEKVFLNFAGQEIKKGQPLFTLYSPDLVSTEQEYLIALKGQRDLSKTPYEDISSEASSLLSATRERLRLWDVTEAQIHHLETTGKASRMMTLYSPISGVVTSRNAYEQTYVTPQTDLYDIADLSKIWVYADIFEYEAPYVHVGQAAQMQLSYMPGKTYRGKVTYVYPTLDPKTRTIKVRLEFPNPDYKLKPNMYANVKLKIDYGAQTLVPSEAVLNSGTKQVVFLAKPDGYFEPREIKIGDQFDGQTVVLAGLKPGQEIVESGNFLIDSESRLGAAMKQMMASMPNMKMSKKK
jgi:RND family efflux transporter MFP subunit